MIILQKKQEEILAQGKNILVLVRWPTLRQQPRKSAMAPMVGAMASSATTGAQPTQHHEDSTPLARSALLGPAKVGSCFGSRKIEGRVT